jgi:amphiphysin
LSFSAGDMIRVIKRTATDQDWWEGELHNIRGSFPANYCRPVA